MPLVGNICEIPHTLLRMCKRSPVHVYEATLDNPDFKKDKCFQSSYGFSDTGILSFKQLHWYFWKSLSPLRLWNSGLCGAVLLSVGRVSPGTTRPTEYSKKDWVCFTRHNIIWNDLRTLLWFRHGIFVTKDIGKDSHLSCCNIKRLQQTILVLLLLSMCASVSSNEATLIYITAQG